MDEKVVDGRMTMYENSPDTVGYVEYIHRLPDVPKNTKEIDIARVTKVRVESPTMPQPDDNGTRTTIEFFEIVEIKAGRFKRRISEATYYNSNL